MENLYKIIYVSESNGYGIAVKENEKWHTSIYSYKMDKNNTDVDRDIIWKMNELTTKGYIFQGVVSVETESEYYNIRKTGI